MISETCSFPALFHEFEGHLLFGAEPMFYRKTRGTQTITLSHSPVTVHRLLMMMAMTFLLMVSAITAQANSRVYDNKYAALVMDAESGLILHQDNANKRLHPASLTKMMTLLMAFDAIDRGTLDLNDRIYVSRHAASMVPSKLGLKPGETIRVKDAIYALVTKSANDVAAALAEKIGGSESNFALMMTKKARALGMSRTRFRNASGLHDPKQVSTARDMGRLARTLLTRYKRHYHYFSSTKFTYKGKTYRGHNRLMDTYPGMDGMKTGYIRASGFNLVSSAVQNDRRLIGVVFGGKTGRLRNAQMEMLLDRAFKKAGTIYVASAYVPTPSRKPVPGAQLAAAPIVPPTLPEDKYASASSTQPVNIARWTMLNAAYDHSMFNRMIGEGDYDMGVRNRIETGLISISAHMGEGIPNYVWDEQTIHQAKTKTMQPMKTTRALATPVRAVGDWTIQVGAFSSRDRANRAIASSISKLPAEFRHARTLIAPMKTARGWIYRGRLKGYTKSAANDACAMLNDCIALAPQ